MTTGALLRACRGVASSAAPRLRATKPTVMATSVRFFSDDKKPINTGRWVVGDSSTPAAGLDADLLKLADQENADAATHVSPLSETEILHVGSGEDEETIVIPGLENDLEPFEMDGAADDIDDDYEDNDDTLQDKVYDDWDLQENDLILPEMMNWMLPKAQREPLRAPKEKLWTEFVKADLDPVELALNVDLLRLFISPNGRMLPRRFTGLRAKQQRQLATAIKNARQMALLPYTSRYPMPSPEQMKLLTEQAVAQYDDFDFDAADNERGEDEIDAMYVED
ncbi:30S ribosomal protein S18 [Aphanomyces invadans]|uniref:30S ribosomal protein S18 n=1 Tax=Aphanomyces invadans TaxID=157072 RepID=A0A024UGR6_9STRA|nr:30S ribosomal protein S18 [Aphanomyces invadans]ETW05459.1 30S ribosomal protein S18 [Aphanomyces invadans]|eukprot:XP_008865236.1 30S ribosomal protein S18 [Aphanomyces invadans]